MFSNVQSQFVKSIQASLTRNQVSASAFVDRLLLGATGCGRPSFFQRLALVFLAGKTLPFTALGLFVTGIVAYAPAYVRRKGT